MKIAGIPRIYRRQLQEEVASVIALTVKVQS